MNTEVSAEVVAEKEPVDPMLTKIRADRKLKEAVLGYLEAKEQFKLATVKLGETSQAVRDIATPNTTIVVGGGYGRYHGNHFLLNSDDEGFDVEPIEVI